MKTTKRMLTMLLTLLMILSVAPVGMMASKAQTDWLTFKYVNAAIREEDESKYAPVYYGAPEGKSFYSSDWPSVLKLKDVPKEAPGTGWKFLGFRAHRSSDSTFYVSGHGWKRREEIKRENLTEKLYQCGVEYKLDGSWKNPQIFDKKGKQTAFESYTFFATWDFSTDKRKDHTWSDYKVTDLTPTDARIHATIKLDENVKFERACFYFGTNVTEMKKNGKYVTYNKTQKSLDVSFKLSEFGQKLSPNTTYYYQIYLVADGMDYYSDTEGFTTPSKGQTNPTVTLSAPDHIEKTSARVHLVAKNPSKLLVTARGVQVRKKGASAWSKTYSEDLSKKDYNKDTKITGYFDIGSGKEVDFALSPNTTYEYRCFVTSGGTNYYSKISTFKTKPENKPVVTLNAPDYIQATSARVHLVAKNPGKWLVTARGVQVKKKGASAWAKTYSEDLSKKDYNKDTKITGYFDIGSGKEVDFALSPNTTYEYRCFVTSGGTNYYSGVSTFKTLDPNADPVFSKVSVTGITDTNAKLVGDLKSLTMIKGTGFYFGTSQSSLKKITKDLNGKADKAGKIRQISFPLNNWHGKLTPGTTYYYQLFYLNSSGKKCASKVYSFKTKGLQDYTFTIKYAANGGSGKMADQSIKGGQVLKLAENAFEKAGCFFMGWNVKRGSDSKWYVAGQGWRTAAEISKNKWTKKVYENGGSYTFDESWTSGAKTTDTFTFTAVWKACDHVWNEGAITKTPTTKATGVKTFTCTKCGLTKTEKIPMLEAYQFKFHANGGKGTMAGFRVEKGETFTIPENGMKRDGYFFEGWTVKRASDNKWYVAEKGWLTEKAIKDQGLSKKIYDSEVSYEFNDGWINGKKNVDTYTFYAVWRACKHDWSEGVITKAPTTKATGVRTFTCANCGMTKTEKIPMLEAYQFKFHANGGKGTMAGFRVEKGESFVLPLNAFKRDGYFFKGWTVKRASDNKWYVAEKGWLTEKAIKDQGLSKKIYDSEVSYEFNDGWINGKKNVDTYTFYAKWTACEHNWGAGVITKAPTTKATGVRTFTCASCGVTKTEKLPLLTSYQVKYHANGGKGSIAAQKLEKDGSIVLPACVFERSGYVFAGWTVYRSSDKKWMTQEQGWTTEKGIATNALTLQLFQSGQTITLDKTWINGTKNVDTYTFYAKWVQV